MDAPFRQGEPHTPFVQVEIILRNDGNHPSSPVSDIMVSVDALSEGSWASLRSVRYQLSPAATVDVVFAYADVATHNPQTYRFSVTPGAGGDLASIVSIYGIIVGYR